MRYKETFLAALREFQAEGRYSDVDPNDLTTNFRRYLQNWQERKSFPRMGSVPETTFWLIDAEAFIGRLSLRHRLNERLIHFGGHIGYEIRPSQRRQGYGKTILRLGLEKAKTLGIRRVLVTCDDTNLASAKIIEANGGALENIVLLPNRDVPTRRYWIAIKE